MSLPNIIKESTIHKSTVKISVIIPTCNRPQLLQRAIGSVYAQDLMDREHGSLERDQSIVEVIIIINGNDTITQPSLLNLTYPNLTILSTPEAGAANARNIGVNAASGEWIAFLDDDDEWLPQKLRLQYQAALNLPSPNPLIASQLIARTPHGDAIRPRRFPKPKEHLSEYLLGRTGFFQGEGLIQTSVIFTKRSLLLEVPFPSVPKHQDWEWVLRLTSRSDIQIEFIPQVLAIWYLEEKRPSVSAKHNYQASLDWIRTNRHLVTPKAYAAFLLVEVASQAAQQKQKQLFPQLLAEAFTQGQPNLIILILYVAMWLLPLELRRKIRAQLTRPKASLPSSL